MRRPRQGVITPDDGPGTLLEFGRRVQKQGIAEGAIDGIQGSTDPGIWEKLGKDFEELDADEAKAPRESWLRVHADPAPGASELDQRVVYILDRGIGTLFRLNFIEKAQEAGNALGIISSPDAAFNGFIDRVWDDAYRDNYEFLQYQDQFYSILPPMPSPARLTEEQLAAMTEGEREKLREQLAVIEKGERRKLVEYGDKLREQLAAMTKDEQKEIRGQFRIKRVGELTRVCQAAAISCWHLKQESTASQSAPASAIELAPVSESALPTPRESVFSHSGDYRNIDFRGKSYTATSKQAILISFTTRPSSRATSG